MTTEETPTNEELQIGPAEELPEREAAERERLKEFDRLLEESRDPYAQPPEQTQFTLLEMFGLITLSALGMASVRWFPSSLTAGLLGVAMLLVFLVTTLKAPESPVARKLCVALLVMYVSAAAGVLLRTFLAAPELPVQP